MEERNNDNVLEEMPVSSPEITQETGSPNKGRLKIIIPVAIVAVLLVVLLGIAAVAGLFGNKKKLLINAVANVFNQSAGAVGEVWAFDEYRDMFAGDKLSMEADFSLGEGVELAMDISKNEDISGASIDVGYYGSSLFQADLYADKEEILIGAPALTETVFYVDRENLDEDMEWFIKEYGLDDEVAGILRSYNEESRKNTEVYEELGQAVGKLTGAFAEMYDEMKVEKADSRNLKVDGEGRSCKGYTLTISDEQLIRLIDVAQETYESNEAFQLYVDSLLAASYGYVSPEEFRRDYEYDLGELLSDLGDTIVEEQREVVITFYVYRKNLAYLKAEFWEGISVEWNVYGGNFPLENTKLVMTDGYETNVYSREGSLEGNLYKAGYQMDYDGDTMEVSLEYDMEKGDLELKISAGYGLYTLDYLLEGEIDRTVPGSELTLSIDTFEMNDTELLAGDITFSDEAGEITKPEGERRNIMRMTQADWYKIAFEIAGNLYSFGG